ncbi:hypothetical protein HMI55_007364, partial [Coelomomyces lativittatus]
MASALSTPIDPLNPPLTLSMSHPSCPTSLSLKNSLLFSCSENEKKGGGDATIITSTPISTTASSSSCTKNKFNLFSKDILASTFKATSIITSPSLSSHSNSSSGSNSFHSLLPSPQLLASPSSFSVSEKDSQVLFSPHIHLPHPSSSSSSSSSSFLSPSSSPWHASSFMLPISSTSSDADTPSITPLLLLQEPSASASAFSSSSSWIPSPTSTFSSFTQKDTTLSLTTHPASPTKPGPSYRTDASYRRKSVWPVSSSMISRLPGITFTLDEPLCPHLPQYHFPYDPEDSENEM